MSGLIESAQVSWLSDPQKIPYLSSPLTVYGVTSKIIPLPLTGQSEDARLYLNEHVLEPLLESKGGTLVYLAPLSSTLGGALDEVLYSHGLRRDHGESDELVRIEKISLANQQ